MAKIIHNQFVTGYTSNDGKLFFLMEVISWRNVTKWEKLIYWYKRLIQNDLKPDSLRTARKPKIFFLSPKQCTDFTDLKLSFFMFYRLSVNLNYFTVLPVNFKFNLSFLLIYGKTIEASIVLINNQESRIKLIKLRLSNAF